MERGWRRGGSGESERGSTHRALEECVCTYEWSMFGRSGSKLVQTRPPGRRSTTELHPKFSEAPHLASSIPHPKMNFSKIKPHPNAKPHGPSIQQRHLSKPDWHFDDFGVRNPRNSESVPALM